MFAVRRVVAIAVSGVVAVSVVQVGAAAAPPESNWEVETLPATPGGVATVVTVTEGFPDRDVWAFVNRPDGRTGALRQHGWDAAWQAAEVPDIGRVAGGTPSGAHRGGPQWVVGARGLLRWDGQKWEKLALPATRLPTEFSDITSGGEADAWLAGTERAPGRSYRRGVVYKFDGTNWSPVEIPRETLPEGTTLRAIQGSDLTGLTLAGTHHTREGDRALILSSLEGAPWVRASVPPRPGWSESLTTLHTRCVGGWTAPAGGQGRRPLMYCTEDGWQSPIRKDLPDVRAELTGIADLYGGIYAVGHTADGRTFGVDTGLPDLRGVRIAGTSGWLAGNAWTFGTRYDAQGRPSALIIREKG
ncbi:hypothetical protein [Spirillospora sp. CA-294931]|uniref:hypothetical protein n=1 Tax=Spirillospora sp. CA-294931 TaxID=3240042 RepID=UPI003D9076F6